MASKLKYIGMAIWLVGAVAIAWQACSNRPPADGAVSVTRAGIETVVEAAPPMDLHG